MVKFLSQKIGLLLFILSSSILATAQQTEVVNSPSFFETQDKIYVVVLVISTIFVGIIAFLIFLERKMNKLEKLQKNIS